MQGSLFVCYSLAVRKTLKKYLIPHAGNKYHPHLLHTKHTLTTGVFFLLLKALLILVAVFIPAQAFVAPDVLAEQGAKLAALTNAMRTEQHLPALQQSSMLIRSADFRAEDMNQKQYFSHVSPEGHHLEYFLKEAGYPYAEAGENLAMGFSDPESVMTAWMKSPEHYANLAGKDYQDVGIALVGGVYQGKPTVFVAQHFGLEYHDLPAVEKISAPAPVAQGGMRIAAVIRTKNDQTIKPRTTLKQHATSIVQALPTPVQVAPTYDPARSLVHWRDSGVNETQFIVDAAVGSVSSSLFAPNVRSSAVTINGYRMDLVASSTAPGFLFGSLTVPQSSDDFFKVIIPPTIDIEFTDGRAVHDLIDWQAPKVVNPTPWEKYVQTQSWLGGSIPVFVLVHGLYLAGLFVFGGALLLNIFIEIRKQHPHVIAQTLALLMLIVVCLKV